MSDDLLARERELFGEAFGSSAGPTSGGNIDDLDFDRAASAFPDINLDGGDIDIPSPSKFTQPSNNNGFDFDSFTSPPPPPAVKVTGNDDEIGKFESAFPDIGTTISSPPIQNTLPSTPAFAPRPQVISTPIFQTSVDDEEEPEVIRKWREEQAEAISLRDKESERKKRETIATAQRSIDQFYEEYNAKKERQIKENKETESAYLAALADSLSDGTTWSRICDLIGLENSQSKTIIAQTSGGSTDLSRYRDILLRLKREGTIAPGAAGY